MGSSVTFRHPFELWSPWARAQAHPMSEVLFESMLNT